MIEKKKLHRFFSTVPDAPGIYKMKDRDGRVIYIGKAKNLTKRLHQYFQKDYFHSSRTAKLLEKVADIEITAVNSDLEAMILEHNLIKQFQPKYNVIMKDDKNYVYIKITKNEDFPRIQIVRQVQKDGATYIGPKTAAHKVKETFKVLKKIFPFRHCGLDIEFIGKNEVKVTRKVIKYPCIDYFTKRCAAPCIGEISKEDYVEIISNVENFLRGKTEDVMRELQNQMKHAAVAHKFEKAAKIRDKIKKIEDITEKQIVSDPNQTDKDIVNYCILSGKAYFNLFQIRGGKLIGQENFILGAEQLEESHEEPEVLSAFLEQYYKLATDIPKEILIPHEPENQKELEKWTSAHLIIPQRGVKNRLLDMSLSNAKIFADKSRPRWREESDLSENAVVELQKVLQLKTQPKRIECYDISHLSGTDTVGSMVVFEKGIPKPAHYRKFNLRTVQNKPDDFKSMEEVLFRRFNRIAADLNQKDYLLKKATKKHLPQILKEAKKTDLTIREPKNTNDFYILEHQQKKKKSLAAFARLRQHSDKITTIEAFCVLPSERSQKLGYKLLRELIKKSKTKRVYLICRPTLKEYYQLVGFEEIKKFPDELVTYYTPDFISTRVPMVYDKIKLKIDESFSKIPDLVIIDGGKGQLSSAHKIFMELNINIPHVALAKQMEEVFVPAKSTPIILPRSSEALKLLQRARDEAHRFAITYNKDLRRKHFS